MLKKLRWAYYGSDASPISEALYREIQMSAKGLSERKITNPVQFHIALRNTRLKFRWTSVVELCLTIPSRSVSVPIGLS